MIEFISKDPNKAFERKALRLLCYASDAIGRKKMINIDNLLETLGTVSDSKKWDVVNVDTRDVVLELDRHLFKP